MIEVVHLRKGERRPRGDKSLLIECRPGQGGIAQSSSGITMKVGPEELDATIADLERKGVNKVYVRMYGDA